MGIDYEKKVETRLLRPMPLVSEGAKPVLELFS
jgi:hypothetical protein